MNSNTPAGRVSDIHPHAELHASSSAELKVETKLASSVFPNGVRSFSLVRAAL